MSKKEIMDSKKIQEEIMNLKKNLLNLNFQKFSGQLEKTAQIKNAKKQIARLKTKLSNVSGENNA
jgi:large subunit ribosomal protein L29|tara:strand:- start:538 stop:732 length:195 start_codon:yes stop_codon:yes gene_type:complete